MRPAAVSQVNQDRIRYKVKTYLPGNARRFKVASDCIGDLFLEFAQVLALRCNSAFASGSVPGRDKESGLLTWLDLKDYFVHIYQRTTRVCSPSILSAGGDRKGQQVYDGVPLLEKD